MTVQATHQIHAQFQDAFNAGDIDRLMELYEPDAAIVAEPGKVLSGTSQVREGLQGLLALNGQITLTTQDVIEAGDLALLSCTWSLKGTGPDGNPLEIGGVTSEVARRQSDGSWRYVIDNPIADQTMKMG